eukprot:2297016-Rhodomonas_salina.3
MRTYRFHCLLLVWASLLPASTRSLQSNTALDPTAISHVLRDARSLLSVVQCNCSANAGCNSTGACACNAGFSEDELGPGLLDLDYSRHTYSSVLNNLDTWRRG